MCQWGAAELARRGVVAEDILSFYYPGTQLVQLSDLNGQTIAIVEGGT
jgi:peptidoglycan hydrolase-like amidase